MADVIDRFDEKLVIYHIVDKYAAYEAEFESVYSANRRSLVEARERTLVRRADLVLVTSKSLLAEKQRDNQNTHWVPNAVDYEAFAQASLHPNPPADAAALPTPIIGYVGAINEKLDYDLLAQVAGRFSDCSLMLVGPVDLRLDLSGLDKLDLPNVHFMGAKPVSQVARYMAACQVCLMPYKLNEWTAHINPLKLFEYLATGKPIVSTSIPAVSGLEDVVYIAQDNAEFGTLIQKALTQDNAHLARQRMELAARNTWDDRVERISSLIEATPD
jgi:glycosyltransferase involved in cell wall biosynthesis